MVIVKPYVYIKLPQNTDQKTKTSANTECKVTILTKYNNNLTNAIMIDYTNDKIYLE